MSRTQGEVDPPIMRAWTQYVYGPVDVLSLSRNVRPAPKAGEVLVRVRTTSVTTADWRIRAAAFPGGLWLAGRLMMGLLAPRTPTRGMEFAGDIEAVGEGVTKWGVGDNVFGMVEHGAHAEYLVASQDGCLLPMPATLSDQQATALPFGGICSLVFLRDVAKVKPGQRMLIVGASGGVGAYAVQIAKKLGAHVSGVASTQNQQFCRDLGADEMIDYTTASPLDGDQTYDLIFDTVGKVSYAQGRTRLKEGGLFLPLNFGLADAVSLLMNKVRGRSDLILHVNGDRAEDLQTVLDWVSDGAVRPVIDTVYPFETIQDAYAHVERRSRAGAVLVQVAS
ncbi:MAG: NAD(P)-dependent alcohol dehydrogenase [Devosiaceae bacterium]